MATRRAAEDGSVSGRVPVSILPSRRVGGGGSEKDEAGGAERVSVRCGWM